jgi:predicted nucleotidyltransferase
MEPVEAAADFVATHFADALCAFVGGSALTADRTPTSDLDLVVLLDGRPAPYRETFRHRGWVVEAFVHTRASLDHYYEQDRSRRVCSLMRMCGESRVVVDRAGIAEEIQIEARRRISAGPGALTDAERDAMRYAVTDLLDDLEGCRSGEELLYISALTTTRTAELALAAAGAWSGTGKALHRAVRNVDPELARRLVEAHGSAVCGGPREPLRDVALEVLARVGGPLLEGYRLGGRAAD